MFRTELCIHRTCPQKISEIDKNWLKQYFVEVANTCIDYCDEWEYKRLVELVVLVIPELKQEILAFAQKSESEELREILEDFQDL